MTVFEETADRPAARPAPARPLDALRPFYWSVRREIWENRSIWRAPVIMSGVILLGLLLSRMRGSHVNFDMPSGAGPHVLPALTPYAAVLAIVGATGIVISLFYCLGALHGERRDRSILFWKSLPVSDRAAVLAKLAIPMLVIPLISFAVVIELHLIIIAYSTAVIASHGGDPGTLWSAVPLAQVWLMTAYGLIVLSLWHAPLWGWLLLVSAWAKRMPILWAFGIPLALFVLEALALGTGHLKALVSDRLVGGLGDAFQIPHGATTVELGYMTPLRFITSPDLWLGLLVAAIFVTAAVWIRRRAEPI